jgi:hypothetical protein
MLPGLSVSDALKILGEGWELDEGSAAGTTDNTPAASATGATNSAQIIFTPSQTTAGGGAVISAVLSDNGNIAAVTFTCSMEVLGYPAMDFYRVISDQELLYAALGRAGLTPDRADIAAPAQDDTAVWQKPDDPTSGLRQETWTFRGYGSGARENAWTLTVTYDYGDAGTNNATGTDGSTTTPTHTLAIEVY